MKMEEGENVAQYVARIKEVVSAIRGYDGKIDDDTVLSKVLRTLLPIYAIRVSPIQELRCIPRNDLSLEGLVGRLTILSYQILTITSQRTLNQHSKPKFHSKILKRQGRKRRKKKKSMYLVIVTQMKKTLNNWRHYWQEGFIKEKADIKVSYLSFVSIAMKLVILQQDAHKRRLIKKEASTKTKRKMMEKTRKIKVRSHATLR